MKNIVNLHVYNKQINISQTASNIKRTAAHCQHTIGFRCFFSSMNRIVNNSAEWTATCKTACWLQFRPTYMYMYVNDNVRSV